MEHKNDCKQGETIKDDPEKGDLEKVKDDVKKVNLEKLKFETTSTSREQSLSINIEDVPEYQKKSIYKHFNLAKAGKKLNKKNGKTSFKRNYFVYTIVEEGESDYDPETRNKFVAKVFLIVFCLLFFNGVIASIFRFTFAARSILFNNFMTFAYFLITVFAIFVVLVILMMYCEYMRRPPCTWIILVISFIVFTILLTICTLQYQTELIIVGIAATATVVFFCFLIALTKIDFTKCMVVAIVMVISVMVASIAVGILKSMGFYLKPVHIAVLVCAILVQSFVLIIELQMVLGGKTIEFSEDDLALPTFMVYWSIVTIFLEILELLGLLGIWDAIDISDEVKG